MKNKNSITRSEAFCPRPFTIALDVAAGDIYFASPDTKTIKRGKMDGSAAPVVIYDSADASAAPNNTSNPGIRDVRGIALDVAAGMIYWTDRGTGDDRVVRGERPRLEDGETVLDRPQPDGTPVNVNRLELVLAHVPLPRKLPYVLDNQVMFNEAVWP